MEDYKIGDFIKIINRKHKCYDMVGRVLKIDKNTVFAIIYDCDQKEISINKKHIELIPIKSPEWISIPSKKKKKGIDYYFKKAFKKGDFDDIILFNFMRPEMMDYEFKNMKEMMDFGFKNMKEMMTREKLLDMKVNKKEMKSSKYDPCVYFTPVPRKFVAKYFSKELVEKYNNVPDGWEYPDRSVFICLDNAILCNLPENHWIGINVVWSGGPDSLFRITQRYVNANIFYDVGSCKTKLDLSEKFMDFFMKSIMNKLKEKELYLLGNDIGLSVDLDNEEKFINFLRKAIYDAFMSSEIFVCLKGWVKDETVTLKFENKDLLIANYEKDTVEENIMRVLGK